MKLKKEFVTQEFHGQQLMVAVGAEARRFHGLTRANETAAFIVDRLKNETSEAGIVAAMLEEYEVDEVTALADVRRIVNQLREIGAIEE